MGGEDVPFVAKIAGSRVLGPRPGKAIVSFWQGRAEIVIRAVALVLLVVPLIPVGLAVTQLEGDSSSARDAALAGCAVVVMAAGVGALVQGAQIILRFLNVGAINLAFKIYGLVDIAVSTLVCIVLLVGAIISAYAAAQYSGTSIATYLGAACGMCFLPLFAVATQATWMLMFILAKWNRNVISYTIKSAVLP